MSGTRAIAVGVLVLLAGCQTAGRVIDPAVADLADVKRAHAAGDHVAVVQADVTCRPVAAGCAQLRFLKADSCSRLAIRGNPDRRRYTDCAIRNQEAALAALERRPDPELTRRRVEAALLDASVRRRDSATGGSDAAAQNRALLRRAARVRSGPNARPLGQYYIAEALMNDVVRSSTSGRCGDIASAAQALADADPAGTAYAGAAANLRTSIRTVRAQRGCPA